MHEAKVMALLILQGVQQVVHGGFILNHGADLGTRTLHNNGHKGVGW